MRYASIAPIRARNNEEIAGLVGELERQANTRRDYVVPVKDIGAVVDDNEVKFTVRLDGGQPPAIYEPTYRAHETLWNRLEINKNYYERMGELAPDLLATNVNYWTERSQKNFMVRTLDDKVRAFMSDRFRRMDSAELFFTAFQECKEIGAHIVQIDLTENNFYMKMLHPDWAIKVENFRSDVWQRKTNRPGGTLYHVLEHLEEDGGQWLVPGAIVSNSDVGYGSMHAELFAFDTICWNGLVHSRTIHQVHLGKQLEVGFVSDETRALEDAALWSKVRDLLRAGFDKDKFLELATKLQKSAEMPLDDSMAAVDTVVKNFSFTEDDKQSILNELLSGGSGSVRGLIDAVTAVGRDKTNQDETIRFERAGGDILENPRDFVRVRRERKATAVRG